MITKCFEEISYGHSANRIPRKKADRLLNDSRWNSAIQSIHAIPFFNKSRLLANFPPSRIEDQFNKIIN